MTWFIENTPTGLVARVVLESPNGIGDIVFPIERGQPFLGVVYNELLPGLEINDFNPNHEPAGSEKGGEFAEAPGATAEDLARFRELKDEWARINNELLKYVNKPDDPEAQKLMDQLRGVCKELFGLNVDPGGIEGIGMPGGARDVTIVGAGPGGLASAIMGGTEGLDTLLIEANDTAGGQAANSSRIENYPGFPIGTTGEDLANKMFSQAERVGAETLLGVTVTGMSYDEVSGLKTLTLSNGESVTSRSVILAGGVQFNTLDFEGSTGSNVVYGNGKLVASMAAGESAVIIGGSNGAAQAALGVAQTASRVYMVSRSPITTNMSDYQVAAIRNNPKITLIENDLVSSYNGSTVTTSKGQSFPAKAVGVFVGSAPNTSYVPSSIRSDSGKIVVNGNLETSIPGVYAVGDVRVGGIGRIGGAVGDGQMAVKNVFGYFTEQQQIMGGTNALLE
jgi:thioredoxin reductase